MDDAIPSISSGAVGSRFVSQDEIESARERRDEQWRAAYARLGQEPPPLPVVDDTYDGRSLAEKLAANKAAKLEEWEEKSKLANQFRALEEDEVKFLDSIKSEQDRRERKRKQEDNEEVKGFKQAIAARNALPSTPPTSIPTPKTNTTSATTVKDKPTMKKGPKNALKGVIVKKKKPVPSSESKPSDKSPPKDKKNNSETSEQGPAKRRRESSPS